MSVRQDKTNHAGGSPLLELEAASSIAEPLGEGNSFAVAQSDNPLKRIVAVSIKASLNELCLQKARGTWAPSQEALRNIFQQKKFTSLDGSTESMGDLKSIVLHDMKITHVKSNFPLSLGARISGVDDCTYSATGESFSTIVLPQAESTREKILQADDVALAYEFAKKDHPIVSAISENADKLQMGEISMMPEGLVKISQQLYESILPLVRTQVESQIKVRDMSRASVSIQPAEYASWSEARSELMVEAKRPLKAQLTAEVAAAGPGVKADQIRVEFDKREKALENEIDYRPLEMHMEMEVQYNFLSK